MQMLSQGIQSCLSNMLSNTEQHVRPFIDRMSRNRFIKRGSLRQNFDKLKVENLLEQDTVELQWLDHLWDNENMFEIGVVRANECLS